MDYLSFSAKLLRPPLLLRDRSRKHSWPLFFLLLTPCEGTATCPSMTTPLRPSALLCHPQCPSHSFPPSVSPQAQIGAKSTMRSVDRTSLLSSNAYSAPSRFLTCYQRPVRSWTTSTKLAKSWKQSWRANFSEPKRLSRISKPRSSGQSMSARSGKYASSPLVSPQYHNSSLGIGQVHVTADDSQHHHYLSSARAGPTPAGTPANQGPSQRTGDGQ